MGGAASSSKYGQLFIKPESGYYYPGANLEGTIFINITQQYPGRTVFFRIVGTEYTHWSEEKNEQYRDFDGQRRSHRRREYYTGQIQIFLYKIPVYTFQTSYVTPGQYKIPVQFRLPDGIPSSFNYHKSDIRGYIEYKIEAEIESLDKGIENMISSQVITIREPNRQQIQQTQGEMRIPVTTWCCIDQGSTRLKAYFEKNAYAPGEVSNVMCEIDNSQCELDMQNIQFVLINKIHFVSDGGHNKHIVTEVATMTQPGLKAKETAVDHNRRVFSMPLRRTDGESEIQPSAAARLITNSYFLRIKAEPDGCTCCSDSPFVEVPISIYAAEQVFVPVQPPPNWNPVSMPPAILTYTQGQQQNGLNQPNFAPPYGGNGQMYNQQFQPNNVDQPYNNYQQNYNNYSQGQPIYNNNNNYKEQLIQPGFYQSDQDTNNGQYKQQYNYKN